MSIPLQPLLIPSNLWLAAGMSFEAAFSVRGHTCFERVVNYVIFVYECILHKTRLLDHECGCWRPWRKTAK